MSEVVRVMVVDDTITFRQILSKVVNLLPGAELAGTASSGNTALMKLPSMKPDLILLDVMMPGMDGLETLLHIKETNPEIDVVMISAFNMDNAKATLSSLEQGALDFISKPVGQGPEEGVATLKSALTPIINILADKKRRQTSTPTAIPSSSRADSIPKQKTVQKKEGKVDIVVIGISTGGPNALQKLIPKIKSDISCPVLIVQHMPPLFTQSLAERLQKIAPQLTVNEAANNEVPKAGHVYIAPGGKHMVLRKRMGSFSLAITDSAPVNHCKPSVDVLFQSVANHAGVNVLSVIMTGMGRDGTEGVKMLKQMGANCIIQDEETSVVWGMPGSVYDADLADEVLSLDAISDRINQVV